MSWRLRVALMAAAVAAALTPSPPAAIERLYSTDVYLSFQPHVTALSNSTPLSLLDVLIVGLVLLCAVDVARGVHTVVRAREGSGARGLHWLRLIKQLALRTASWAAVVYLVFLVAWGFNYRRVRLIEKLAYEPSAVNVESAQQLALRAADELRMLHEPAHRTGWSAPGDPHPSLAASFEATIRQLGVPRPVVVGRPKRTALDWYFRRAGVDGMTDPFFLETLVATDLLSFERPFVVAHEWSHLAGFADEGDANFVGWLTCLHGPASDQYSGWLFLYSEVAAALPDRERAKVADSLAPGPRADLRAIAARVRQRLNPRVAAVGGRVYDRFLKANRVEAGAASYAQVVQLALGVRFADGWVPQLR